MNPPLRRVHPGWGMLVVVVLCSPAFAPPTAGADESTVVALLDRARAAAQSETYRGLLLVQWQEGRKSRTARVSVQSAGGVMKLGDDVVGSGAHRLVRSPNGWETLWRHDVIALGPSADVKYTLSVTAGPQIAGHPTDLIEVRRRPGLNPRERLFLDRDTGLILRQELLDARGKAYHSVGFVELSSTEEAAAALSAATATATPVGVRDREPSPTGAARRSHFHVPKRLGDGYRLVGTYERPGNVLHLFYSDGLHGLSVFEQRGRLSKRSMPAGGEPVELAGHQVRSYSTSVGQTVVWEGDGVVYTLVSDAHRDDVTAAVADLSHAGRPGRLQQVADAVAGLFRWR